MTSAEIGLILARERRKARLTQKELAQRLGTSQSAVSRTESGGVTPRLEFIDRWAEAIGRPITITLGVKAPQDEWVTRERVRRALGAYRFDPWSREPSPAERRSLRRDGLTREPLKPQSTPKTRG